MTAYDVPVGDTRATIACDATGCGVRIERVSDTRFRAVDAVTEAAKASGWSLYVSRGRRHYCPEHGPRPGHSMRLAWGEAR